MDVGTIWTRNGKRYRLTTTHMQTKDAQDGNWSPAVGFRACGPGGRAKVGAITRVLSTRDFTAQYQPA